MGAGTTVTHVFPRSSDIPLYNRHTDSPAGHYKMTMAELRTPNGYLSANELEGTFVAQLSTEQMSSFFTNQLAASDMSGENIDFSKLFGALVLMPNHCLALPDVESIGDDQFKNVFVPSLFDRGGVFIKQDYNGEFEIPKYGDPVLVSYSNMADLTTGGVFLRPKSQGNISRSNIGSGGGNKKSSSKKSSKRSRSRRISGNSKSYYDVCKKKAKTSKSVKDTKKASNLSKQQEIANAKEKAKLKKQDAKTGGSLWGDLSGYVKENTPDTSSNKDSNVVCKPFSSALGLSGVNTTLRYANYRPLVITPRKRPPLSIVIHDTAGQRPNATPTFKALLNKKLSSHYIITDSGVIYETADPGLDHCRHASGGWNPHSIGIDLTCPVIIKSKNRDLTKSKRWTEGKNPFSQRLIQAPFYKNPSKKIVDYTEAQKRSLARLVKALCNKYNIPRTGIKRFRAYNTSPRSFRGVIGHSQFQGNRVDGYNAVLILEKKGILNLS